MSASGTEAGQDSFLLKLSSVIDAYEKMEMEVERYLLLVIAPAVTFFIFSIVAAIQAPFPLVVRLPVPALGLLMLFAAVVYPKLQQDKRKKQIGDRLHLFITHMTILSTTNIDRVEVFRTLAAEDEYKALADEMHQITQLVDTWNQSLDDACRMRAKRIPDKELSDFLERMAYTLNAGQELEDFLISEQDAVIRNYVTHYRSSLDNLEVLKDLYLSMLLSMTFALVFATVLPILTGTNPTVMVAAVFVMFVFVQLGFLYTIRLMTPNDPLWYRDPNKRKPFDFQIIISLVAGVLGVLLVVFVLFSSALHLPPVGTIAPDLHTYVPTPFYMAMPLTPLLIPAMVIRREEAKIWDRDDEFASFIRALGATESVKQSTTGRVLETLRTRDFGPLTDNVNDLYRRLNIRIDTQLAWDHFVAESRSYLIQKFSEMYVVGRELGGDPKVLGELISQNMNEVLQLREQRKQASVTFLGLLYGITAASAFAFFIGLEVVEVLSAMSADLEAPQMDIGTFIYPGVYNIPMIEYLLMAIIIANAALSSLMIRVTDGGHMVNGFLHFVMLSWIGATVAWVTSVMVGAFLAVG